MKEGWEYKKLGEVATVSHGKNQKEVEDIHGEYPIYGSGGNIMGYANSYLCESGTTILGRKGTINNPLYIETKFWNVDTAFGITAKDGNNKKYIYYFVKSQDWSKKDTGTTLPSLTQKVVKETIIPVPPLSEQQRIVSYLDAAFAKIDAVAKNAEDALNEAKALFQSALTKMMEPKEGWEEKHLDEVAENCDSKRIPVKLGKRKGGEYPYYGASGIVDYVEDYIFDGDFLLISEDGANLLARVTPIAFSVAGKFWVNNHTHILKFNDVITQQFVELYFKSTNIKEYVTGAAQPKLTQRNLNKIPIYIPSLKEQQPVVCELQKSENIIQQLQSNLTRTLSECSALKQAILRQTFE